MTSKEWLTHNGKLAQRYIVVASFFKALNIIATIVQWWGLSKMADSLVNKYFDYKYLIIFITAFFIKFILQFLEEVIENKAVSQAQEFRQDKLLPLVLPIGKDNRNESAQVASSLIELIKKIAHYQINVTVMRVYAYFSAGSVFILVLINHWPAAVILFLATLVIPANMWIAGKLAKENHNEFLDQFNQMSAKILDSFKGLNTLKHFQSIDYQKELIGKASDQLIDTNYSILKKAFLSGLVMDLVVTFSIAVMATYIGMTLLKYVDIAGASLYLQQGLFILLLTPMYFTPFREMAASFHDKEDAIVAADKLSALKAPNDQIHKINNNSLQVAPKIEVENMQKKFDQVKIEIPNLEIPAKSRVAITGKTGAGKTTLLKLIAGIITPSKGIVTWFEGNEKVEPSINNIAWIGQTTLILPDTLRANLQLANKNTDDLNLIQSLDKAGLSDWYDALPNGLDTVLGNNGVMPSAGEQKRLAFSRAFLHGSKLWLVDEPTSHLDLDNEKLIIKALSQASKEATVVIATHSVLVSNSTNRVYEFTNQRKLIEVKK